MDDEYFLKKQEGLISELRSQGISDEEVLKAMSSVKRNLFTKGNPAEEAFGNYPLPIGHGQTISQPYTVAFMLEKLGIRKGMKVLEVGTGSGYNAAIISRLLGREGKIISMEIIPELYGDVIQLFEGKDMENVVLICGDGSLGCPEEAPFDRIIVTAAAVKVPMPLIGQLADPGKMVIPVGHSFEQEMMLIEKKHGRVTRSSLGNFVFVPLRGKYGTE
jgi:protein-L-isoaspartate(D-aspartate) O-methyltransferase